uniref:DNA sliding clamp PCNA n=1 Tax=Chromera velia CCMP2878 TaxID=1169474 RepID=A0A0G4FIY0_9ALVE|mmetsp:Transcript_24174/g.47534  ORF Transcript_24174/g.47534 Transcript_24174/m.47534 type:complete len:301 (+) Transcript_24174:205-1107(+)|eukprot:Cvel_17160.t1-p1 / transcript=Cvel_17160.t1 / gene=Cvel_17160 / organism=Chromera_velia_CCMP2878 / gene_product=Proliferating cell nuclear antigen, putative / transcript_product=Proliferating cell nuclear antigen, putative / location=Cvel_scaffold1356:14787-18602(-) / protein_length=300 / sequence_SO=supercontig / SO=protein_coding / is_pseudo=false
MLDARFIPGSTLKRIVDSLKDHFKKVVMNCTEEGVAIQAMDESHVSLAKLHLPENAFDFYRCDQQMDLGMDLSVISKVFHACEASDCVHIKADKEKDTVSFAFKSMEKDGAEEDGGRYSKFDVALINLDVESLAVPEEEYEATVVASSSDFQKICRNLVAIASENANVEVIMNKENISFKTTGDKGTGITGGCIELKEGSGTGSVRLRVESPISLTFPLRYLRDFTKASSLSESVMLSMNQGKPICVHYPLGQPSSGDDKEEGGKEGKELDTPMEGEGSGPNRGYLSFWLAPQIDEEHEE